MKYIVFISVVLIGIYFHNNTSAQTEPDFSWGNGSYFSLNVGETVTFQNCTVQLLGQKTCYNLFKIGADTVWLKVSRHTLPKIVGGIRIFVADNKNVKALTVDSNVHGLLKKDVLVCLSEALKPLLDPNRFYFPISFNDGFLWSVEENSTLFAYLHDEEGNAISNDGMDFDLHSVRGLPKHWIVALENSSVVWVEESEKDKMSPAVRVLLKSDSQPNIYYMYNYIYGKSLEVKKGDKLVRGEPIGTAWGDKTWGHLHFSVMKSDTVPAFSSPCFNVVNCFPQLFGLYFKNTLDFKRIYTKGKISFGRKRSINGNKKNCIGFEEYSGKGWILGDWNCAGRVEWVANGDEGNARVRKMLFINEPAECTNPKNYFDFEINVKNGVYRIRAEVGDSELKSWQKVQFENVVAATYSLKSGEYKWTAEKVVKVRDGKLTVRIFVDEKNKTVAGIKEIVFQRVY